MKHATRLLLATLAGAALAVSTLPATALANIRTAWVRTWFADPGGRGLVRLTVERTPSGPVAIAWGTCHPNVCLWGSAPLKYAPDGLHAAAVWTTPSSVEHFAFQLSADGQTLRAIEGPRVVVLR
jgi:hypothetical protein